MICPQCGLVVGDRIVDVGTEWRVFPNEKSNNDPARVGASENPLLNGSDLATMIGKGTGDASFDESGTAKYQNRKTMSSSDRALVNAFREISNMADRINLTKTIVDRSNLLFKQVHDGKTLKGRSNDAIASACLYIACRQEGVPRTFKGDCICNTKHPVFPSISASSLSFLSDIRCRNMRRVQGIQKGDRTLLQAHSQGPRDQRRSHHDGRLHVSVLLQSGAAVVCSESSNAHCSQGSRVGRRLRAKPHLGGSRCYLHGIASIGGQEVSERDRGHCRSGGRHHPAVVQAHVPTRRRTVPGRLQVLHAHRAAAAVVKTPLPTSLPPFLFFTTLSERHTVRLDQQLCVLRPMHGWCSRNCCCR
ncbi:uncharacterized protein LOC8042231 isoform X2 [Ixodes scapularis]|nr:uncharacterized protein LOC8042231 isoform X2 [Ixodes scapularis]